MWGMNKKFFTVTFIAVTLIGGGATTTQATAPPDDSVDVNIATLVDVAPVICIQVDEAVAAGADPSAFIKPAVESFAQTYANAVGIELLTEFFHGLLVGCAAN